MIALYPGAFKPPHRGHFEVVKSLLQGNHGGKVYDIDNYASAGSSVLKGDSDKLQKIRKVLVFIGEGGRNGITRGESTKVWKIYAKYIPGVVIMDGGKNPMLTAKDYAKANQQEKFYAVTGVRSEEDLPDLKRVTTFKNRDNVQGLVIPSAEGSKVRATDFRKAILSGNLDEVLDFFPSELSKEEILNIISMLKSSIIAEKMSDDLDNVMENIFKTEGSSGTATAPKSIIRSEDRDKLLKVFTQLRKTLDPETFELIFNQNHIRIQIKDIDLKIGFDYTPFMASLLEYMINEGHNIVPLPEVKIKRDMVESSDFFGKTAYYEPTKQEVVLYVEGRHPKDVMRSFAHEMIHHKQNIEGRLGKISTTDTNKDDNLLELEKEAYLEGNIAFRNWEDSVKN
jgi:hypothetical protein|tara:strand:+ start:2548 stop:3738 length:1191 start_codon:yes stop_codon:yes gene_type:complete